MAVKRKPEYEGELIPIQSTQYANLCHTAAKMLARGGSIMGTAMELGIGRTTLRAWKEDDHFRSLMELEKDKWRRKLLSRIEKSTDGGKNWQAGAWLLERSPQFENQYAQPQYKQDGGGNITVQIMVASPRDKGEVGPDIVQVGVLDAQGEPTKTVEQKLLEGENTEFDEPDEMISVRPGIKAATECEEENAK